MGAVFSPGMAFKPFELLASRPGAWRAFRETWLLPGASRCYRFSLLSLARSAPVDPLCISFLEELRQCGLQEWLASLSFDNPECPDLQLTMGAVIVEEIRVAVEAATGFRCSAGISHNKVCV